MRTAFLLIYRHGRYWKAIIAVTGRILRLLFFPGFCAR